MFSLRFLLAKLSRRAEPDADFVRALNKRLLGTSFWWQPWTMQLIPRLAALILVLVPVGGVGTSVYAYKSDQVLPQHPLYGVRLAIESWEQALAPKSWQFEIKQQQLARRAEEARLAQAHGVALDQQFTERLIDQADRTSTDSQAEQGSDSESAQVVAASLQELMSQGDLVGPEEKGRLDKMAYQQAEAVANDLSDQEDDLVQAERIDLKQIEEL